MAGYLLYVPGEMRKDHRAVFPALGLGTLCDNAPDFLGVRPVAAGPDGGEGTLFAPDWSGPPQPDHERTARLGYFPDEQAWEPCCAWETEGRELLKPGRFWLGKELARPPTFDDLLRPRVCAAMAVTMPGQGKLYVPVPDVLPHRDRFVISPEGRAVAMRELVPGFEPMQRDLLRLSGEFLDDFLGAKADRDFGAIDGETFQVRPQVCYKCAAFALAINYLVTPEILHWLGWLADPETCGLVCRATIEEEAFQREWEARKKKHTPIAG